MDERSRLQVLVNASVAFSEAVSDLSGAFERIARRVSEVLRDLCVVRLLSSDGQSFDPPVGLWDSDPGVLELLKQAPAVAASEAIGPEILRTGRPIVMTHIDPAEVAARLVPSDRRAVVERLRIHSVLVVPLRAHGQILGIVTVARRQEGTPEPFTDADLALLEALADRAALAISHGRVSEQVARSREQLQVIGDSLPVLVSLLDRSERYLFVNATYQKWFGRPPSAIVGRTLEEVVGGAAYQALAPHVRAALSGRAVTFQTRAPYVLGGHRDIEASYTPYLVDGRVEGFVALVSDVTDRVQMEGSLKAAVAVRDEFLSIASHELRTPLAAMLLQVEGAQRALARGRDGGGREKVQHKLDQAIRQIDRLSALVDGLLSVSRVASGRFRLELEPFDLAALVAEICERFEEEAARTGSLDQPPAGRPGGGPLGSEPARPGVDQPARQRPQIRPGQAGVRDPHGRRRPGGAGRARRGDRHRCRAPGAHLRPLRAGSLVAELRWPGPGPVHRWPDRAGPRRRHRGEQRTGSGRDLHGDAAPNHRQRGAPS